MKTRLLKKLRRQAAARITVTTGPYGYEVRRDGYPASLEWRYTSLCAAIDACNRTRRAWIAEEINNRRSVLY